MNDVLERPKAKPKAPVSVSTRCALALNDAIKQPLAGVTTPGWGEAAAAAEARLWMISQGAA